MKCVFLVDFFLGPFFRNRKIIHQIKMQGLDTGWINFLEMNIQQACNLLPTMLFSRR
jgi:hypothetical protein